MIATQREEEATENTTNMTRQPGTDTQSTSAQPAYNSSQMWDFRAQSENCYMYTSVLHFELSYSRLEMQEYSRNLQTYTGA